MITEQAINASITLVRNALPQATGSEARALVSALDTLSGMRTELMLYRNGKIRKRRIINEEISVPDEGS